MKFNSIFIMILFMFLSVGCSNVETEQTRVVHEAIEAYTIENFADTPNKEGIIETNGFRKVNSITYTEESGSQKTVKVYELIDYYDKNGTFTSSVIKYSDTNNNANEKIENKPITILAPDKVIPPPPKQLTEEEKKRVKEHVLKISSAVSNVEGK